MIATSEREKVVNINGIQVWLSKPKRIINGVVLYGRALSGDHFYPIAKRRTGNNRFSYRCGCDSYVLSGRLCKHIATFIVVERGEEGVK